MHIVTCLISLDAHQIINDAHVITVIRDLPNLQLLANSLYNCDYSGVFKAV